MAPQDHDRSDSNITEQQASGGDGVRFDGEPPGRKKGRPAGGSGAGRILRKIAVVLGSIVGGLLALVVILLLILQTDWGTQYAADTILDRVDPFRDAELVYDEIDGNWISWLELRDAAIVRDDTVRMVQVDTLHVRYRLLSLLFGTVHVRSAVVDDPRVYMRQQADSTWDLLNVFQADTAAADTTPLFAFRIDELLIDDGRLAAAYYAPDEDSTLRIQDFNLAAEDIRLAEQTTFVVDYLGARVVPPGTDEPLNVLAEAALLEDRITVDVLRLDSPVSTVTAEGVLPLPGAEDIPEATFTLRADPLAFRDLQPFLPALPAQESVTLELLVSSSDEEVRLVADGRLSTGATLALEAEVSSLVDGPLQYAVEGQVRRLDPGVFTAGQEPFGDVNADVRVDMAGLEPSNLDGTARLRIFDTRIGERVIQEATLVGEFDDGRGEYELAADLQGGDLTAEGFVNLAEESPSYGLTGRFRNVDPGLLANAESINGDLSGRLTVRGDGFDPQTMELAAELNLTPSTLNDRRIERANVDVSYDSGEVTVDLAVYQPDGFLTAEGEAALLADPATYRLSGQLDDFQPGLFIPGEQNVGALTGAFSLEGRGTDPETANITADVDLAESVVNQQRITQARAELRLVDGDLRFDVDLRTPSGFLALQGEAFFRDDRVRYRVSKGAFENLNLAIFTGADALNSNLTGTFSLAGTGLNPEQLTLEAGLQLEQGRIDTYEIGEANLDVALREGQLRFEGLARLEAGTFDVQGTAFPFRTVPTFEARGQIANVNLARLAENIQQETDITGTFTLTGRGATLEELLAEAELELAPSRIGEQEIETGRLALDLERGQLALEADVETPEGGLVLAGRGDLLADTFELTLEEGRFENLNIGAFLDNPELASNLTGAVSAYGSWGNLETGTYGATLRLEPSTIRENVIEDGLIEIDAQNGLVDVDARIDLATGFATLTATGRFFAERPTYDVEALFEDVELEIPTPEDLYDVRLSAVVDVEGEGLDPETMEIEGHITADDVLFDEIVVDSLNTDFSLADGMLNLPVLLLRSNVALADASGQLALYEAELLPASNFAFEVRVLDTEPLTPFLPAEVFRVGDDSFITGRLEGRPDQMRFDAEIQVQSLVYGSYRAAGFDGRVSGILSEDMELVVGEARGEAANFSIPQLILQNVDFDVVYTGNEVRFDVGMVVDRERDARIAGRADLNPENQRVFIEAFDMRFGEDRWELLQEAVVTFNDEYRVSGLLLYAGDQQIALDGVIDLDGEQNLVLTVEAFQIGGVADLLEYDGLAGVVDGSLVLTGPAASPRMEGDIAASIVSFDEAVGDLRLELSYNELQLNIDALITHVDQSTLAVEGYVPLDLRLQEAEGAEAGGPIRIQQLSEQRGNDVSLDIVAERFNIGWVEPFLDREVYSEVEGKLTAEVAVNGTFERPDLSGEARVVDGRLGLTQFDIVYNGISAAATLEGNQVLLRQFEARSGGGEVVGEGTIELARLTLGEFDLEIEANDFLAVDSREYRVVADAELSLVGTTREPAVEGSAELISADFYLVEAATAAQLETVELSEDDLLMLERIFGLRITEADTTTFDFYEALALELDVSMERDVWLRSERNPEMLIQFTGDLDVVKEPFGEELAFGTIEVIPERSFVNQFGRRFDISSGTLVFNGPVSNPLLNIEAEYTVPARTGGGTEIVITLAVEGQLEEQPTTTLTSDPPMDTANIVSYIATGRPAGEAFFLGGNGQGGAGQYLLSGGAGLAFGQLASIIESAAGAELGLDVIEIRQEGLRGATVTAGKYVTRRLFAAVSVPLSFTSGSLEELAAGGQASGRKVTVEYTIFDWLLARVVSNGSVIRTSLLFENNY